jgi:hypothetical protein
MANDHVDTTNFGNSLFRISFLLSSISPVSWFGRDPASPSLPLVVILLSAKNMPEVQIKLQARKYRKIADD